MSEKKLAYILVETCRAEDGGYIPCIVKEGETGYYPTNWNYGNNLDMAQAGIDKCNEKLGLTPREVLLLALASVVPQTTLDSIGGEVEEEPPFYREFPDIKIPKWLMDNGWEDNSWHNDALAKSEWAAPKNQYPYVRVWVAEDDPAERDGGHKFCVQFIESDYWECSEIPNMYVGDDEVTAQLVTEKLVSIVKVLTGGAE